MGQDNTWTRPKPIPRLKKKYFKPNPNPVI